MSLLLPRFPLRLRLLRSYSTSPSSPQSYATPLLPLPHHIPASTGLLLIPDARPVNEWPSHIEQDPQYAAIEQAAKKIGVRVLTYHSPSITHATLHTTSRPPLNLPRSSIIPHLSTPPLSPTNNGSWNHAPGEAEILICTHGSRDCRCSDIGGDLVAALREDIARSPELRRVKVTEVSHVGGHKFAANAILLPSLHLLSNLRPSHSSSLLALLTHQTTPSLLSLEESRDFWRSHYRGSFALTVDAQTSLYETSAPPPSPSPSSSVTPPAPLLPTPQTTLIRFTTFDNTHHDVPARIGESLMDVAKREGLGNIEGSCGGHLECATCHLYLPPTSPSPSEISEEEEDMLGYALGYKEGLSRLGCQVVVTRELGDWSLEGDGVGLPRW